MIKKVFVLVTLTGSLLFGGYKVEKAGAPPEELAAPVKAVMSAEGTRLVDDSGKTVSEIWLRAKVPPGSATSEQDATLSDIPNRTLVGAIRFVTEGADRRGQVIQPGVYTLRYALHPIDGAHQGVAFQRDFFLLVPAANDTEPDSAPSWEEVVAMSKKASGTVHPAVLEAWKDDMPSAGPLEVFEGRDWVLHAKVGNVPVALVLIGTAPH